MHYREAIFLLLMLIKFEGTYVDTHWKVMYVDTQWNKI